MTAGDELYGLNLFGEVVQPKYSGPVAERFVVPPFSVLDTRQGFWIERRRAWIAVGIESELGRDPNAVPNGGNRPPEQDGVYMRHGQTAQDARGGRYGGRPRDPNPRDYDFYRHKEGKRSGDNFAFRGGLGERMEEKYGGSRGNVSGVSIFDPVICELVYRWFAPAGGQVIDPFAGGSVRGVVAGLLGLGYWGCDLSAAQVEANRRQWEHICPDADVRWAVGDAVSLLDPGPDEMPDVPDADLVFSCPPYGDLEVYSEDPRDLSTMDYPKFCDFYRRIIRRACAYLRPNRFACFVVADYRDRSTGAYRGFVGETVDAFREMGLSLYNEAILVNSIGSLPVRITQQFERGRKLGKCHQNVLVFVKGDWRAATAAVKGAGHEES